MPLRPRSFARKAAIVILMAMLLMPSPLITASSNSVFVDATIERIDPALTVKLSQVDAYEMIPIILHFSEGSTSEEMLEAVIEMDVDGIEIRHVFSIIPMVSAYASRNAVLALEAVDVIQGVSLDKEIAIETSSDVPPAIVDQNGFGYVHPDALVDVEGLWSEGYDGTGITVAIIDSGAMGDHPDLNDRIIGFIDLVEGTEDLDPSDGIDAYDDNGHGTACAWMVAGTGQSNGGEYKGMAPGADLLIIKALDAAGVADDTLIAKGIEDAVLADVDVISLSLGGPWLDIPLFTEPTVAAIKAAIADGVIVTVAAGNDGPAALTLNTPGITEEAITVGAFAFDDLVAAFSSRGPVHRTSSNPKGYYAKPDIAAPGYRILSARAAGADSTEYPIYNQSQYGDAYTIWSGTSTATPLAAGLAALLLDKHIGLSPIEAKAALMLGATDIGEDSMAQGWGVVNVTRSSEILNSSSGVLTLMTPRKFPALPGSQSVFVAGDERDPLNVTVISTVGRGTLTIEITGDASSYVTTSVTSLIVGVGYSHFGVDLKIPENLPLTAVGQYTGWLSLMDGPVEIAAVELNFSITSYRGSVLADSSHHSAEDPDDPSYYRYFSDYLREQGMTLDELGSPTYPQYVDTAGLSNCETFMIMDTETEYTGAEIEAIHQFVEEGGTLLIVSEYYNSQTQSASFGFDYYNEILQPYGIQCERFEIGGNPDTSAGEVYGIAHGGAVDADPLVDGVFNLFILAGSTLSVDPSVAGAKGLFWYDSTRTHAIVATVEHGDGKVIAVSDGSILYDSSVYDAFKADADNLQLLENIARALLPERPSVLDIELNREELGEPANVTAYIFDDDIESVVITITTPNGTVLAPTVQESLGYRFVAGFILETAGFYEVTVTAQDADGNTRVVLRTFLIEAVLVDDAVVLTVVYSLLGVVALGLGYVALRKLGIGRRREREWEPTWTEGESGTPPTGAPPSIE